MTVVSKTPTLMESIRQDVKGTDGTAMRIAASAAMSATMSAGKQMAIGGIMTGGRIIGITVGRTTTTSVAKVRLFLLRQSQFQMYCRKSLRKKFAMRTMNLLMCVPLSNQRRSPYRTRPCSTRTK